MSARHDLERHLRMMAAAKAHLKLLIESQAEYQQWKEPPRWAVAYLADLDQYVCEARSWVSSIEAAVDSIVCALDEADTLRLISELEAGA